MYSRSYPDERISIPEKYSGTALESIEIAPSAAEEIEENESYAEEVSSKVDEKLSFSFKDTLGALFSSEKVLKERFSGIGYEELMILSIAALLFFSKDPDIECAIMLLVLFFIK